MFWINCIALFQIFTEDFNVKKIYYTIYANLTPFSNQAFGGHLGCNLYNIGGLILMYASNKHLKYSNQYYILSFKLVN